MTGTVIPHAPRPGLAAVAPRLRGDRGSGSLPEPTVTSRAPRPRLRGDRGQASIEVLGFLPVVIVVALVVFTVIAAHAADEQAGEAAEAGALVLLQGGGEPYDAAKEALPKDARGRSTITVSGRRVHVRVRPRVVVPIPGLPDRLAGEADAEAGPATP